MAKDQIVICPGLKAPYSIRRNKNLRDSTAHSHPYWEMILFQRGEGQHIINGISYPFCPGNMVLLSPTDVHSWINSPDTTHDCTKVIFTYNMYFTRFAETCRFLHYPVSAYLCSRDVTKALQLMDMLEDEFHAPHSLSSIPLAMDLIESLLILLQRNLSEEKSEHSENTGKLHTILQYLQEHFREPITISDAAVSLNYSPKYFSRLFSKEFGITFQDYLKTLRLNHAYHLIKYSDMPVIDVCYNSGFRSPTYFSTSFKEKYGMSPNHLRKHKN